MAHYLRSLASAAILLSGCASHPDNIDAKYVSPVIYQNWTCDQLGEERIRLGREVGRVVGLQRENANGDAVMMTVGLVLVWPVLFGLAATKDRKDEVGRLKGEYEAVDAAGKINHCVVAAPIPAQPVATPPPVPEASNLRGKHRPG